jgi:hypothetical protein
MLVKNNLPTVLDFGSPLGTTLKDPGGKNHGVKIPGLQLLPGMNDVDPAAWAMWTGEGRAASKGAGGKPAGLDWHLQEKNVEVVKVEVEPADDAGHSVVKTVSGDEFADLRAEDAIAVVKETFDVRLLDTWGEAENDGKGRRTVLAALEEQVDLLNTQVSGTVDEDE